MVFNFILAIIFIVSTYLFWYSISQKIPEIVAIPDHVITERLHEESAKIRLFLLHLKSFYRTGKYKEVFWKYFSKILYRLHIVLLKIDNGVMALLKKTRVQGIAVTQDTIKNENGEYWSSLQKADDKEANKVIQIQEIKKKI